MQEVFYFSLTPDGGTSYDTVVCGRDISKSDTVNAIDSSSACGPDSTPGDLTFERTFSGIQLQDPDSGKLSSTNIRELLIAKTIVGYKIAPETPVEGDEIESGTGYFSDLSSNYSYNDAATFDFTFKPIGTPTISIQGTS